MALTVAVAIGVNLPHHFEFTVRECFDQSLLRSVLRVQPTHLRHNVHYVLYYKLMTLGTLMTILPFVLISVFSLITVNTMRRSRAVSVYALNS